MNHFGEILRLKFDFSNYATKTGKKNSSYVDTLHVSCFALKSHLVSLKTSR